MSETFSTPRERIDRVRARAWALQILYRWEAGGSGGSNLRDALVETTATRRVSPRRLPYVRLLLDTVDEHLEEIDARLRRALDNWRMERLSAIDRGVLRLATAEMLYLEEIPPKVAIQEAVRLGHVAT